MAIREWDWSPGRIFGKRSGVTFFDTDAFPLQYANENQDLLLTSQVITFPDYHKGWGYCWQQWDGPGGNPTESAVSVVTIPNQEWGPSASLSYITSGCDIPDVVVGTIPALADNSTKFFVRLTRTNAPSNINGNAIPTLFNEGEWVECPGGSLPLEWLFPVERMIQFYLAATDNGDGTRNVMMRKLQSTVKQRQSFYRSGNNPNKTGWIYGGTYGSTYGIPVNLIGTAGPSTDLTGIGGRLKQTTGALGVADNTDYISAFTGDILIVPGRAQITPESGGGDPNGPYFIFTDEEGQGPGTTKTFVGKDFSDPTSDRVVFANIIAFGSSSGATISSVTIGGIAATLIARQSATYAGPSNYIAGIYAAVVPTGNSGNIVVTFSAAVSGVNLTVYAGYNLGSMTPDAVIQSSTLHSPVDLPNVAGGFAFACGTTNGTGWGNYLFYNMQNEDLDMDGIKNAMIVQVGDQTGDGGSIGCRGHQNTDGTTLAINYDTVVIGVGGPPGTPATQGAWVAASFH